MSGRQMFPRSYRARERAEERNYENPDETRAFRHGYRRGFDGNTRTPREVDGVGFRAYTAWPNAWSAGYWEGAGDADNEARSNRA